MAAEYLERMGARIRGRREELGMSRSDVARAMPGKTNENAVYRWEKGAHRPMDDTLEALAKVLKVDDVSYFLASAPEPGTADLMGGIKALSSNIVLEGGDVHEWDARLGRVEAKLDALMAHQGVSLPEIPERPRDVANRGGRQRANKPPADSASRQPRKGKGQAA